MAADGEDITNPDASDFVQEVTPFPQAQDIVLLSTPSLPAALSDTNKPKPDEGSLQSLPPEHPFQPFVANGEESPTDDGSLLPFNSESAGLGDVSEKRVGEKIALFEGLAVQQGDEEEHGSGKIEVSDSELEAEPLSGAVSGTSEIAEVEQVTGDNVVSSSGEDVLFEGLTLVDPPSEVSTSIELDEKSIVGGLEKMIEKVESVADHQSLNVTLEDSEVSTDIALSNGTPKIETLGEILSRDHQAKVLREVGKGTGEATSSSSSHDGRPPFVSTKADQGNGDPRALKTAPLASSDGNDVVSHRSSTSGTNIVGDILYNIAVGDEEGRSMITYSDNQWTFFLSLRCRRCLKKLEQDVRRDNGAVCQGGRNSGRRNHYTDNNIQVCFPDDEEIPEDDHTPHCESRCRHSIIGSSDGCEAPDTLMSFGIQVEDVRSPSSRRACRQVDFTADTNLTNNRLEDSGTLVACRPNATNGVGISDGSQDDNYDDDCASAVVVNRNLTVTESSCTQTPPATTHTASGPSVIQNSCTQTPPLTTNTASGPDIIESSCTQIVPSIASTAAGPDATADCNRVAGNLDISSLSAPTRILPSSLGGALGPPPNSICLSAGVSASDQPCEAHRDVHFMRENAHFHFDLDCPRPGVEHLRPGEDCQPQRRCRKELDVSNESSAESMHSMEEGDGSHFEGYIYGIIREKGNKSYKRRLCRGNLFVKERRGQTYADCSLEKMSSREKSGIKYQETCIQSEGGKICGCGNVSGRSQKAVEGLRALNYDTLVCKDKDTSTSSDVYSGCSPRGGCSANPTSTMICKEKTRRCLEEQKQSQQQTEKSIGRDKGNSTCEDTFPASTKGSRTGRPLKQTRTRAKEETRHVIDDNLGAVAKERRGGGFASGTAQLADPLAQTKSSLKALTETEHWSMMSLAEQYEYLVLLDSTLAAASCTSRCPTPDIAHRCFQGDAHVPDKRGSSGRHSEYIAGMNEHQSQHCATVTCLEALQVLHEEPIKQAQTNHTQTECQPAPLHTTCGNQSHKPIGSMSNKLNAESSHGAHGCPQSRNLHYEAARDTLARARVREKKYKYHS